jgi:methyl halide transferase
VIGLDVAPMAISRAARFPKVGGESYRLGDLFDLSEEFLAKFDWVFEHTCFCAIHPARRVDYVRAVGAALLPGGFFLAILFLQPWDVREEPPEGGPPFGVSTTELEQLFFPTFEKVDEMKPLSAFPGREGREIVWLLRKNN